jgi:hypothetical protein
MNVGKQRFSEVLAHHIDKCQHEQSWDILQEYLFCEVQALCFKCCFLQLLQQVCWWCNVRWSTKLMPIKLNPVLVTIRITNRCDFLYYVFISFFSSLPYMFRAFMSPSSGVLQAIVFMLPFGSLQYKTFKDFKLCCVRSELFMYIGVCCIVIYCLSC